MTSEIKKVKPVDKTLVNFGKKTLKKLDVNKKYCFRRISKKIMNEFTLLTEGCN